MSLNAHLHSINMPRREKKEQHYIHFISFAHMVDNNIDTARLRRPSENECGVCCGCMYHLSTDRVTNLLFKQKGILMFLFIQTETEPEWIGRNESHCTVGDDATTAKSPQSSSISDCSHIITIRKKQNIENQRRIIQNKFMDDELVCASEGVIKWFVWLPVSTNQFRFGPNNIRMHSHTRASCTLHECITTHVSSPAYIALVHRFGFSLHLPFIIN